MIKISEEKPEHAGRLKILNWNVGGAKYLELEKEEDKIEFKNELNNSLKHLIKTEKPHVITLQEIIEYKKPTDTQKIDIVNRPNGYKMHKCILINNEHHSHVSKWDNVSIKGNWPDNSYFSQGNAILWREDFKIFPVWSLPDFMTSNEYKDYINENCKKFIEEVFLMSGLYFGDRNTEPRAALVAHFVVYEDLISKQRLKRPLDVFIVNLHLTTITKEREGIPEIDNQALKIRLNQINIILNGIVSRYNKWRKDYYKFRGTPRDPKPGENFNRYAPIWILSGDFNFTPKSLEYDTILRSNFIDVNPHKGNGTKGKWSEKKPTITVDYIFAGPKYNSLDPIIIKETIKGNKLPITDYTISDHYPLSANIDLTATVSMPDFG
ncbi:MAG: hypothetical protein ACFFA6_15295 [Promethearchaeota archaeon]